MIDWLLELFFIPAPIWIGVCLGMLAAGIARVLLPDSADRAAIGGWLVGFGFIGGLGYLLAFAETK